MYAIDCYTDLCTEIEIAKTRIDGLEGQKKELKKLVDGPTLITGQQYSDLPTGNHNFMSLDRLVDMIHRIDSMLDIENGLLKGMFETQDKINEKLKGLKGIEYQVVYKREFENKPYEVIARELNYSSRQIRRISDKLKDAIV